MKKVSSLIVVASLVLAMGVSANAATYRYHDSKGTPANNGDWNNLTNWFVSGSNPGTLPGEFDTADLPANKFGGDAAEVLTFGLPGTVPTTINCLSITAYSPTPGVYMPVTLTVDGQLRVKAQKIEGGLWSDGMLTMGSGNAGKGTIIMNGGLLEIDDSAWIGSGVDSGVPGNGELIINGGTVKVGYTPGLDNYADLTVGRDGSTGHIEMAGGDLYASILSLGTYGTINFSSPDSKIVVNNTWQLSTIQGYLGSTITNAQLEVVGDTMELTMIPEPATMALLGLGGLLFARRRKA
jgi:hypothetical protein